MKTYGMVLVIACLISSSTVAGQEVGLRQLTDDPAQDGFPQWSPDGKSIVFSRYGGDAEPEKNGLWLVSPEGGEPQRLTALLGEHPHWSPDGNYIAFDGDFGNTIQLVSASGGTPVRIVPESIPVSRGGQPKWSPDGSRIAFKEGPNLWVLDLSTGRLAKAFTDPDRLPIANDWSPDGTEIYVSLREGAENRFWSIWAISATGQGQRKLTLEKESSYRYADLSPDGTLLAVVWCEDRECSIWVMSAAGGHRVQITSHPGYDDGPAWSPDGTKIAFVSTRSGNFDIWTIDVDVDRVRRELVDLDR
ncbi:MAG: PD40 domain-containing protein [Gemmatimonadetes bacterium]|jgi:Tol biopolymer transport system component|nr:PD40 domain-containing protein [Gemmatimonadota bacterium]